ncbi:hypothetical protein IEQ34_012247 [Dendrobium chrysotoxum]|uniref:Uncharacterized protein n=1 Tax=Dendrobium chrysotoxum TaxID=161865 RepID=A0AAV7GUT5_DENCH|nr:hypothetical protein IEQ34_012247 [Dendrobium chrysotoxum]
MPIFLLAQPSMVHNFAITEWFAIFPDIQIVMKPMDMVVPGGGSRIGSDRGKVPQLGILPKYAWADAEMRWFEVPGFNQMHTLNAWQEGEETIILVAPNILLIGHTLERMELVHSNVKMVCIELQSGAILRMPHFIKNLDFGVIHVGYIGRNRFTYLRVGDHMPKIFGVRMLDFSL